MSGWIETTSFANEKRTQWLVRVDGEVLHADELRDQDDPSGLRAYEQAVEWAEHHVPAAELNWKHSRDTTQGAPEAK